jgi:CheY-specific phosphatase CheX
MNNVETQLYQTAVWTFEELAFMFCTPELLDEVMECKPQATASVTFSGPMSGKLVVSLCGEMLSELASNMLGQEESPSEREQLDALGEVANVICGNILPKVTGSDEVFRIDAPDVAAGSGPDRAGASACISVPLSIGRADLALFVN